MIGAAYGLLNPAASDLLVRHALAGQRSLIFAIKQTGVPLGGIAAGLLGPPLAFAYGWHAPTMGRVRGLPPRRVRVRVHAAVEGLRSLAGTPALLSLALSSFCSSAIQLSVIAFLVVLLVEEVGFDLVGAGIVLAAAKGREPSAESLGASWPMPFGTGWPFPSAWCC